VDCPVVLVCNSAASGFALANRLAPQFGEFVSAHPERKNLWIAAGIVLAIKWPGGFRHSENEHLTRCSEITEIIEKAYARNAMLLGIRFLDYGRTGGGMDSDHFKEKLKLSAFWGMIVPVVLSGLLGWKAVGLNLGFAAIPAASL
jgi:hypothetical protein